jgi:molybdopterin-guanine dinucleotide biosynthesis protein A
MIVFFLMKKINHINTNSFPNTFALVMCGGQSNRMGTDKSMLQYFAKPQRYHVYDLLLPYCEKVFIACNIEQAKTIEAGYDFIYDNEAFSNIGPIGALLTAFTQFPEKNILLIGCDYPFLKTIELELFSALCKDIPASFYNQEADIYESMLAWYPYSSFEELTQLIEAKQFSLQQLLKKYNATKYLPADINCITSIDNKEAFIQACKLINAE